MPTQVSATATAGSVWTQTYTLTQTPNGPAIDLTGLTFSFVIRPSLVDTTSPALVQVSSAASNAQGSIAVTPTSGIVTVNLLPAATALLGLGERYYTLWSNYGTSTANAWVDGTFTSKLVALG